MLTRKDFVQSNNKLVCLENTKLQIRYIFSAIYWIVCYNMIYWLVQVLGFEKLHIYFVCIAIDQMIKSSNFSMPWIQRKQNGVKREHLWLVTVTCSLFIGRKIQLWWKRLEAQFLCWVFSWSGYNLIALLGSQTARFPVKVTSDPQQHGSLPWVTFSATLSWFLLAEVVV